jgi:lambda repressor-like predicted transcriptional regulator
MAATAQQNQVARGQAIPIESLAEVLPAYLEKSPVVQAVIRDLLDIVRDDKVRPEDRRWAEGALRDALFRDLGPAPTGKGKVLSRQERRPSRELQDAHLQRESQEEAFATALGRLLQEKGISQAELARRVGVGPSAISMLLVRRRRPQRRTVEKLAQALDVDMDVLWPPA